MSQVTVGRPASRITSPALAIAGLLAAAAPAGATYLVLQPVTVVPAAPAVGPAAPVVRPAAPAGEWPRWSAEALSAAGPLPPPLPLESEYLRERAAAWAPGEDELLPGVVTHR
jgi:hypothetical protein